MSPGRLPSVRAIEDKSDSLGFPGKSVGRAPVPARARVYSQHVAGLRPCPRRSPHRTQGTVLAPGSDSRLLV